MGRIECMGTAAVDKWCGQFLCAYNRDTVNHDMDMLMLDFGCNRVP